ncbi:MAG: PLP-dependent aspartate aminotransferase family protein, partial [Firmicutes bacterium]|nr:PLP-dependent aspartate aminotransferase family protein [Bacillota bacterium]
MTRAGTRAARAGLNRPLQESPRPEVQPVYLSSVYTFADVDDVEEYYGARPEGRYLYGRSGHPNRAELERAVADLEHAHGALATSSGMAAIAAVALGTLTAGDRVLLSTDVYGGTLELFRTVLQRFGVGCDFADCTDLDAVSGAITPRTRWVICESSSNPLLAVPDIAALASCAHEHGARLLVDNTFATPLLVRPLELGADAVLHSATKYLSGHSDVSAGVVCADRQTIRDIEAAAVTVGLVLSPFDAWLATRGLRTLALRMRTACANAQALAQMCDRHPGVRETLYPGLAQHPQHALATKQFGGLYGAIVSIRLEDDRERVNRFMRRLSEIPFAPSLAGAATSLSHPETTSHRAFTVSERRERGITEGLIRISVGIEETPDLLQEFTHALGED